MSATAPTIIAGRYELQRRLAQGGMAEVWLAVDLTLDRRVAVKWLKPTLATDDVVAERFRREAIAAASLNHPNIVAVHDVFEQDGRQAVVMQLVDGKSLRQLLDSQNRLSPGLTCHIGACVADALDHAHGAGFVHRDVKPGNIMITADGRVLLTDFGIAKGLDGAEGDLTNDNIMMGTAKYLSPEQVRGKKLDGRADLYSLGLVLYECLAGRVPFLGETDADTALARLQRDPTDLARLRATLPNGLVSIIHQLLARNPAHRPVSGAEAASALRAAADESPPQVDATDTGQQPTPRLRRAPSDHRGRAKDIERVKGHTPTGNQPVTENSPRGPAAAPPPPAPSIPGEPGATPPAPIRPRDATPPLGTPQRGRPAKGLSHKRSTSLIVIGVLVAIGLAVGGVLWATIQFGSDESSSSTTVLPDEPADTADTAEETVDVPAGQAVISTIVTFDPDGDGTENDELAGDALAGDPATAWTTVCYSSQFMGGKRGVGLVVSFEEPAAAALSVDILNAPYQVQFFTSAEQQVPPSIDEWGNPVSSEANQSSGTVVSATPNAPVRHTLVLLNEIGSDSGCTSANPYRGALNEISVVE
jgi:serine/threonine-protein kinase